MYEKRTQGLAPVKIYYRRILMNLLVGMAVLTVCLLIGILGYHYIADIVWIDAVHNASMILSGMGPVVEIQNYGGKLFSSFYALFSGVVFITNIGFILAPAVHRFLHKMHMDENDEDEK